MLPSEYALVSVSIAWHILQKLCDKFYSLFLSGQNQLSVLHKLCCIVLNKYLQDLSLQECDELCSCNNNLYQKLKNINFTSCKIMLNNFVKKQNDSRSSSKEELEKKKKKTT